MNNMIVRCGLFFLGILVGVLSYGIASAFLKPANVMPAKAIKLTDGESFSVVSDPYVVITGKTGDHFEVILCQHDRERFVINAEPETLKFQSSSYEQGLKISELHKPTIAPEVPRKNKREEWLLGYEHTTIKGRQAHLHQTKQPNGLPTSYRCPG
jgi:hypothetical protein